MTDDTRDDREPTTHNFDSPTKNRRRWRRTRDAAAYCGSTKSTFEKLRVTGVGCVYSKIGKIVVYDIADLDAWLESKKRRSTSEYAA